jgi:hypothetical protein
VARYPETAWWWNPAQPGQALFMEVQGATLFVAVLAYDGRGQASWYRALGTMTNMSRFTGPLVQCQGPPAIASTTCFTTVGTLTIAFSSTLAGTASLTQAGASVPLAYSIQRYRY